MRNIRETERIAHEEGVAKLAKAFAADLKVEKDLYQAVVANPVPSTANEYLMASHSNAMRKDVQTLADWFREKEELIVSDEPNKACDREVKIQVINTTLTSMDVSVEYNLNGVSKQKVKRFFPKVVDGNVYDVPLLLPLEGRITLEEIKKIKIKCGYQRFNNTRRPKSTNRYNLLSTDFGRKKPVNLRQTEYTFQTSGRVVDIEWATIALI